MSNREADLRSTCSWHGVACAAVVLTLSTVSASFLSSACGSAHPVAAQDPSSPQAAAATVGTAAAESIAPSSQAAADSGAPSAPKVEANSEAANSKACDGMTTHDAENEVWSIFHTAAGNCTVDPEIESRARKTIVQDLRKGSTSSDCIPSSVVNELRQRANTNGHTVFSATWRESPPGLTQKVMKFISSYCPIWPIC